MRSLVVSAPGKVILTGEHAVVYGKTALAASLDLRMFAQIEPLDDEDVVEIEMSDVAFSKRWKIADLEPLIASGIGSAASPCAPSHDQMAALKKTCGISDDVEIQEIQDLAALVFLYLFGAVCYEKKARSFPSLRVRILSQFPFAAGLGSSAAFSVCLAAGFLTRSHRVTPLAVAATQSSSIPDQFGGGGGRSFGYSSEDVQLINEWAFEGEKLIHGNPSGIDNSISSFGGTIAYTKGSMVPLKRLPALKILVVYTKVARSTKKLVSGVKRKCEKFPVLFSHIMDAVGDLTLQFQSSLEQLKNDADEEDTLYNEIEDLVNINQCLLQAMGVSHSSVNRVCHLLNQFGVHAKLTGAGGGGCVLGFPRPGFNMYKDVVDALQKEGYSCWKTTVGGAGVACHSDDDCQ